MSLPEALEEALTLAAGARFRRCALQVNPYPYLQRAGNAGDYADAGTYNTALVKALVAEDIELIAITDHDRSDDAGLRRAAEDAGITVFPGTEVCSSDGVHVVAVFDATRASEDIDCSSAVVVST
ncbi:MAG: phosphoesterase, partial [Actinomycetota bacterium]|nr:phosphoesterase [Actinomycetota bacterium]